MYESLNMCCKRLDKSSFFYVGMTGPEVLSRGRTSPQPQLRRFLRKRRSYSHRLENGSGDIDTGYGIKRAVFFCLQTSHSHVMTQRGVLVSLMNRAVWFVAPALIPMACPSSQPPHGHRRMPRSICPGSRNKLSRSWL